MADIQQLKFGKNLRPSTVDAMKKINEIVTAVNQLNPTEIDTLQSKVNTLESKTTQLENTVTQNGTDIDALQTETSSLTTDMNKVKVTLYTPLSAEDTTE